MVAAVRVLGMVEQVQDPVHVLHVVECIQDHAICFQELVSDAGRLVTWPEHVLMLVISLLMIRDLYLP